MTVYEQIHHSKTHRDGFDQACPQCLRDQGISGIVSHLEQCAKQNEADSRSVGDSAFGCSGTAPHGGYIEALSAGHEVNAPPARRLSTSGLCSSLRLTKRE